MNKKKLNGRSLSIICSVFVLLFFWLIYRLYCYTEFYLVFYLVLSSFFVGTVNLFFMLLKRVSTLQKRKEARIKRLNEEADSDENEGKKDKKKRTSLLKKRSEKLTSEKKKDISETNKQENLDSGSLENSDSQRDENLDADSKKENSEKVSPKTTTNINKSKKKTKKKSIFTLENILTGACWVMIAASFVVTIKLAISFLKSFPDAGKANVSVVVFLVVLFLATMVIDRICKYTETKSKFYSALIKNFRSFFKYFTIQLFLIAMTILFEARTNINIRKYMGYAIAGLFIYYAFFSLISIVIIAIRKEFLKSPIINVPMFYVGEENENSNFIEYLEKNTGISMRSLWSVKYIKNRLPLFAFVACIALYFSTCIVNVDSYQQGVVYRIGVMQDELLQPGIHFVLPYPFDMVDTYDTETVNKVTIGYKSDDSGDNIWTASHGTDEYKLLLGGGDELVSINLRLEYKINDLKAYLKTTASPESIMEAMAYELVMNKTIETDLSSLLSIDRDAFADNFQKELAQKLEKKNIGLEVVSVVLESIHPPVEIADVYQQLIGAGIMAEERILKAEAQANVKIAEAQTTYNVAIANAKQDNIKKVASSKANVAEFLKGVEAYEKYGNAYTYQKYLNAVCKAYGGANLVILGDGVNEDAIYFGNFRPGAEKDNDKEGGK